MSLWGRVFASPQAITETAKAARDGIDALVYTEEEKATDAAKDRSEARQMLVGWLEATNGQNVARRLLAILITFTWLGLYIISVILSSVAVFVEELMAAKLTTVSAIASTGAQDMNPAVMLILGFYFAAPYMGDIAKAVGDRFTRQTKSIK